MERIDAILGRAMPASLAETHKAATRTSRARNRNSRRDSFTKVPNALLRRYADLGLSTGHLVLACQILRFQWDARPAFPSIKRLARDMGVDRTTVTRWIAELEGRGLLAVGRPPGRPLHLDAGPVVEAATALEEHAQASAEGGAKYDRGGRTMHRVPDAPMQQVPDAPVQQGGCTRAGGIQEDSERRPKRKDGARALNDEDTRGVPPPPECWEQLRSMGIDVDAMLAAAGGEGRANE